MVPKVRPVGRAKAAGLYFRTPNTFCAASSSRCAWVTLFGLPTRSGNEARVPPETPLATPALSLYVVLLDTVKGEPVNAVVMPETCQPPSSVWAGPAPLKKGKA